MGHLRTFKALHALAGRTPLPALVAFCLLLVGALGAADHTTGYEISFSIFYLAPVAIASWYGNPACGFSLALASATVWLAVDLAAGHAYRNATIPYWNAAVRFGFFAIVSYLLTAQKRLLTREVESARTDPLTGVRNTKGFTAGAEALWELARRYGHTTSLAYIDLDNFKQVNDAGGHAEGDAALKATAAVLRESLRSTDVLGRLGGDEFAALLPETSRAGAEEVFLRVQATMRQRTRERGWPVTLSIGVLVVRPPYPPFNEALRDADELMYRTKHAGKNNVRVEERPAPGGA